MSSEMLAAFVTFEIWTFLVILLALVGYKMLNGGISSDGLLSTTQDRTEFSPGRLQFLIFTIVVAASYLVAASSAEPGLLPDVPMEIALLIGGSSSIYLGGKSPIPKALISLVPSAQEDDQ